MRIEVTYLESEIKELQARINDCLRLCDKYSAPRFTAFLTEEEQAAIGEVLSYGHNTCYFGGFDDAKRKMLGVFPEWQEVEFSEYPIRVISIIKKYTKELTHRDYLGTVLSLGIDRSKIGDILVHDKGAYIFASETVADMILGIEKISNCGVKVTLADIGDIEIPEQQYDDLFCIVPSMRLDAFVAAVTKASRNQALTMIKAGKVSLNHKVIEDGSKSIIINDILSVRGFGRYVFFSEGGKTGSGRIHVHIKKYR